MTARVKLASRAKATSPATALPHRRTHASGQVPRAENATRCKCAAFILNEAVGLGIAVGSNGDELAMLAPLKVPREERRWFEIWLNEFREEVIRVIEADVAARKGASS